MNGRIAVLGADGFIGRHVCYRLRAAGYEPLAIVRNTHALKSMGFMAVRVDLTSPAAQQAAHWRKILRDCNGLINCAGLLNGSRTEFEQVHATAPKAACAALPEGAQVVLISAVGIDADTRFSTYRRKGEDVARAAGAMILRAGLVLGETSYGGSSLIRALAAFPLVIPVLQEDPSFNPIHADDLADVAIGLLNAPKPGAVIEIGGSESLTLSEMLVKYRAWLGLGAAGKWKVPGWLVNAAGFVGDILKFGPISRTSLAQIRAGVMAKQDDQIASSRGISTFLALRPAGTSDLWAARLYLLKPLLRIALAFLWIASGLVGIWLSPDAFLPVFAGGALPDTVLIALARAFGVLDIGIGLALVVAWRLRLLAVVQLAVIAGYTLSIGWLAPGAWAAPFGGMIKNIPLLVLVAIHAVLERER